MVLFAAAVPVVVGAWWGLPGSDSWAADSLSPRSCGLGAIAETYWWGHFHTYPPLYMACLTFLSLPWMALAACRVGLHADAFAQELIKPLYMTGIEASVRLLAAALALGTIYGTMRLWRRIAGPQAGVAAGAIAVANPTWTYYAHTGNLEVPYLFCLTWMLVELDRVASGDRRERQALALATAAVLTKDQAAAALILPVPLALAIVPWLARRESPLRCRLVVSTLSAAAAYAVISGAALNPRGYGRRVAFLLGPASQSWTNYPKGLLGAFALAHDALCAIPHFTSSAIALAAVVGILLTITTWRGLTRVKALLPLAAALSFFCFFTLAARRTEDRFLLPLALFTVPYAAVALNQLFSFAAAAGRSPETGAVSPPTSRRAAAIIVVAIAAMTPALLRVASMDATLLVDPRYEVERYLSRLPSGTHVEVYGGPIFLPRIPPQLVAVRPGVEPLSDRQAIAGIQELVDPIMDPRPRAPDVIVLATELSSVEAAQPPNSSQPYALISYRDARSHALLRGLLDGTLGYERVVTAQCRLPPPLSCRQIHGSTGQDDWVYAKKSFFDQAR